MAFKMKGITFGKGTGSNEPIIHEPDEKKTKDTKKTLFGRTRYVEKWVDESGEKLKKVTVGDKHGKDIRQKYKHKHPIAGKSKSVTTPTPTGANIVTKHKKGRKKTTDTTTITLGVPGTDNWQDTVKTSTKINRK